MSVEVVNTQRCRNIDLNGCLRAHSQHNPTHTHNSNVRPIVIFLSNVNAESTTLY